MFEPFFIPISLLRKNPMALRRPFSSPEGNHYCPLPVPIVSCYSILERIFNIPHILRRYQDPWGCPRAGTIISRVTICKGLFSYSEKRLSEDRAVPLYERGWKGLLKPLGPAEGPFLLDPLRVV
jgi:hypothetical protein